MNIFFITILGFFSIYSFSMDNSPQLNVDRPFIRLLNNAQQTDVQLVSRTYKQPSSNLKVTLLSGMHFAKHEFYKQHNEILNQADAVLYEGKGMDKKGFEWENQPIVRKHKKSDFYVVLTKAYNLAHQLDEIDYQKAHFRLADYSFDEACPNPASLLKEIEEFIAELSNKYSQEARDNGNQDGFEYFVNLKIERQRARPLSDIVTEVYKALQNIEEFLQEEASAEQYAKEYTKRNQIVMDKFAELAATFDNSSALHVVIYYGAGHLQYFERQLGEKYGLVFDREEWITALSY